MPLVTVNRIGLPTTCGESMNAWKSISNVDCQNNLLEGAKLTNPLTILNQEVAQCTLLIWSMCPKSS